MDIPVKKSVHFTCINYPCIVDNNDRMLETIGGEKNLSKVFNDPTKRVELRMRPKDVFCKPLCGDKGKCTGLLMKVRRRKIKRPDGTSSLDLAEYEHNAEVVGLVTNEVKFDSLADFQYLPMQKNCEGQLISQIDKLVLKKIEPRAWLAQDASLFIPPPIFSRIDKPVDYCYRDAPKSRKTSKDVNIHVGSQPNFIGITRQRRPHYTIFMAFDDKDVAVEPCPEAVSKLNQKLKDSSKLDEVRRMFENRRIWSKNALRCHVDLTSEQFKYVLPTIAYYCVTGPWRTFWVKLGYDPRKDVSAKQFQTLDFRVRQKGAGDKVKITPKRSTFSYSLPNTVYKPVGQTAIIRSETFSKDYTKDGSTEKSDEDSKESMYVFRNGLIPAYRQMFYQLCDIEVPDVHDLVNANAGKEKECTERDGWCETDVIDKCREILANILKEQLKDDRPAEQLMSEHSIRPSGSNKGKLGKRQLEKRSSTLDATETSHKTPDTINPAIGEPDDSSDSGEDYAVDGEDNDMETELLDYMDPQYLDT